MDPGGVDSDPDPDPTAEKKRIRTLEKTAHEDQGLGRYYPHYPFTLNKLLAVFIIDWVIVLKT